MSDQPLPAPFNRDPATGLVDGVTYIRQPSGRISWKEMIDPAYIVFNRKLDEELTKIYGAASDKLVYADVIKEKSVEDKHILILLQGFVELAELRGYISAPVSIVHVTPGQNVTSLGCPTAKSLNRSYQVERAMPPLRTLAGLAI